VVRWSLARPKRSKQEPKVSAINKAIAGEVFRASRTRTPCSEHRTKVTTINDAIAVEVCRAVLRNTICIPNKDLHPVVARETNVRKVYKRIQFA
jgi:hypothetical protein